MTTSLGRNLKQTGHQLYKNILTHISSCDIFSTKTNLEKIIKFSWYIWEFSFEDIVFKALVVTTYKKSHALLDKIKKYFANFIS